MAGLAWPAISRQYDGSEVRLLLGDGLGSTRLEIVEDSSLTVKTVTTYEPFGKVLARTGKTGTVYGYAGEQFDAASGLVYLRARYYNPTLNRFASADSIVPDPRNPQQYNRYSYVLNNPLKFIDPTGHFCTEVGGNQICSQDPDKTIIPQPQVNLEDYHLVEAGQFTFSAYVYAQEVDFGGSKVPVPGLPGEVASSNFLFGHDGIVQQGTGRLEDGRLIHVANPQSVQWVRDGKRIIYDKGWRFADTGQATNLVGATAVGAQFAYGAGVDLTPYFSVAAPSEFAKGTLIYSPDLHAYTPTGGVFMVQDRGGAITGNRMDLFVGDGFGNYNNWIVSAIDSQGMGRPGAARVNAAVYILIPRSIANALGTQKPMSNVPIPY